MKKLKKKGVVVLLGLTLCTNSASAAIPVIDDQNILQQLKTYTETLNVVRNTAEQITLQMKELAALPQSILDSYKQAFDESVGNIKEVLASADFFSDPAEWANTGAKPTPESPAAHMKKQYGQSAVSMTHSEKSCR